MYFLLDKLRNFYDKNHGKIKCTEIIYIDDFRPNVVEMLLLYLYNGGICEDFTESDGNVQFTIDMMKVADKYNFTELFDAMDSSLAQEYLLRINNDNNNENILKSFLEIAEQTRAPKTSLLIFQWKNTEKNNIDDDQWSALIRDHPNFAMMIANTAGRKDYLTWTRQHSSWCLHRDNDFSIIVGWALFMCLFRFPLVEHAIPHASHR